MTAKITIATVVPYIICTSVGPTQIGWPHSTGPAKIQNKDKFVVSRDEAASGAYFPYTVYGK